MHPEQLAEAWHASGASSMYGPHCCVNATSVALHVCRHFNVRCHTAFGSVQVTDRRTVGLKLKFTEVDPSDPVGGHYWLYAINDESYGGDPQHDVMYLVDLSFGQYAGTGPLVFRVMETSSVHQQTSQHEVYAKYEEAPFKSPKGLLGFQYDVNREAIHMMIQYISIINGE